MQVFNNTIRRSATGIGIYTLDVGPVASNLIIANTITHNTAGMTAGGYGHDPTKHSEHNIFASNYLEDNGSGEGQINLRHGPAEAVVGDYWTSNVVVGDAIPYKLPLPEDGAGVTAFEP